MRSNGTRSKIDVIDSHIHVTTSKLKNEWIENESEAFRCGGVWTLKRYMEEMGRSERFNVEAVVFIECFNTPSLDEAKWALEMCKDTMVEAVVAHIPCREGASAVRKFLNALRDESGRL